MIWFIGAGPGDPDLITVKGKDLLAQADIVIYAGSLVNPQVLSWAKPGVEVYNSASMTLEEVIAVMEEAFQGGKTVARVHTGDPSLYGAIREQMDELIKRGIPYQVVPGVSSFLAAAAALGSEYTLPGVSQTVIVTRLAGRTPVPEKESLKTLARSQASMCIFLSTHMVSDVVEELVAGGYSLETPAAIVAKASWPDQQILKGTLATIASQAKEAGINKTALILVGQFLGQDYQRSLLYHPEFSHEFRKASDGSAD